MGRRRQRYLLSEASRQVPAKYYLQPLFESSDKMPGKGEWGTTALPSHGTENKRQIDLTHLLSSSSSDGGKVKPLKAAKTADKELSEEDKAFHEKQKAEQKALKEVREEGPGRLRTSSGVAGAAEALDRGARARAARRVREQPARHVRTRRRIGGGTRPSSPSHSALTRPRHR